MHLRLVEKDRSGPCSVVRVLHRRALSREVAELDTQSFVSSCSESLSQKLKGGGLKTNANPRN